MRNGNAITLSILLFLTIAGFGFTREHNQDPGAGADQEEWTLLAAQLMEYLGPRLDHIAENVARRYQLSPIPALRESALAALKQGDLYWLFHDESNAPSLDPLLRAALAKHLNEEQLQDFSAFTQARKNRDRRAAAGQLVAWADRHLSLRSDQRCKLRRTFLLSAGEDMKTQNLFRRDASACMGLAKKLELNVKQLEGVLSLSQAKVWDLMIPKRNKGSHRVGILDSKEREARFAELQAGIVKAFEAGRITSKQAVKKFEAAKQELRIDPAVRRDNEAKWEERIRLIAASRLAAHTEQLGELDAPASKRLTLVTKGVVEQVLESWDAGQRDYPTAIVMDHPLYQQTIKDVLAKDAYSRYQASQAQRDAFRDQALRDLVVAYLDTQLLLSETQRNGLAEASARLTVPEQGNAWALLIQVLSQVEQKELSPWQRELADGMVKAGTRWERLKR